MQINSNEIRKYTDLYNEAKELKQSYPTSSSCTRTNDRTSSDPKCTLIIEVIKAWNSSKNKDKNLMTPMIEIQKLSEFPQDEAESFFVDNDECLVTDNSYIWAQVFKISFSPMVSNVHK